jgi:hypothetical protein
VPLLPERPLRLRKHYVAKTWLKAGLLSALFAAVGGGMAVVFAGGLRDFAAERELWQAGTLAPAAEVEGEVTTHEWLGFIPLGREYKLTVRYADEAGGEHEAKLEMSSFTELDTAPEPVVRYDPAAPGRVALNWTVEAGLGRWAFGASFALVGVLILGGAVVMVRGARRTVESARACARRSDERELPLVKLQQQQAKGRKLDRWEVTYALPPGARGGGGTRKATVEGEPIVLDREGGARVLALLSPEAAAPTFPTVALHPFDVSPDERAAFEARLAAERARSPSRQSA